MIDDLKAFVAAVEEASLTKAADRLCLTQSAVSRRIQQLEDHLDATLLDRSCRPLVATPLGRRVYEKAVSALKSIEALSSLARVDAEPSGVFRLGITHALGEMLVVSAIEAIKARYPTLDVRLRSDWSEGLREDATRAELDAAVVLLPATGRPSAPVEGLRLATLDMAIVQSRRRPIVKGRIKMSALANKDWILNPQGCGYRAALERAIGADNLHVVVDVFGAEMQLGMIASGLGLGVVSRKLLRGPDKRYDLVAIDVSDFTMKLDVWVIHGAELGNLKVVVDVLSDVVRNTTADKPRSSRATKQNAIQSPCVEGNALRTERS